MILWNAIAWLAPIALLALLGLDLPVVADLRELIDTVHQHHSCLATPGPGVCGPGRRRAAAPIPTRRWKEWKPARSRQTKEGDMSMTGTTPDYDHMDVAEAIAELRRRYPKMRCQRPVAIVHNGGRQRALGCICGRTHTCAGEWAEPLHALEFRDAHDACALGLLRSGTPPVIDHW